VVSCLGSEPRLDPSRVAEPEPTLTPRLIEVPNSPLSVRGYTVQVDYGRLLCSPWSQYHGRSVLPSGWAVTTAGVMRLGTPFRQLLRPSAPLVLLLRFSSYRSPFRRPVSIVAGARRVRADNDDNGYDENAGGHRFCAATVTQDAEEDGSNDGRPNGCGQLLYRTQGTARASGFLVGDVAEATS